MFNSKKTIAENTAYIFLSSKWSDEGFVADSLNGVIWEVFSNGLNVGFANDSNSPFIAISCVNLYDLSRGLLGFRNKANTRCVGIGFRTMTTHLILLIFTPREFLFGSVNAKIDYIKLYKTPSTKLNLIRAHIILAMLTKYTLNINGHMPSNEVLGDAFKNYNIEARMPSILAKIQHHYIVALCEVVNVNLINLELKHLDAPHVYIAPYVPGSDKSQYYVYISKIKPDVQYMYWATETPRTPLTETTRRVDPVLRNSDTRFEKGMLVSIYIGDTSVLVDCTIHLGLTEKYQVTCMKMFAAEIARIRGSYNHVYTLVTGDFNTFPETVRVSRNPITSKITTLAGPYNTAPLAPLIDIGLARTGTDDATFRGYPRDFGLADKSKAAIIEECLAKCKKLKDPSAIRLLCAETIIRLYGEPLYSVLDHVFSDIPIISVVAEDMKVPTPIFIYFAVMGHAGLSDHTYTITNFYIPS